MDATHFAATYRRVDGAKETPMRRLLVCVLTVATLAAVPEALHARVENPEQRLRWSGCGCGE
jgi:hypothetical protein